MEHRLENPEWHKTDPTTFHHTKQVAQSAWRISTPQGFTKYDQMVAALGHDFGKIVSGDGHAQIGADLAKQIFPDMTEAQYKAIAEHMGVPVTSLGKATKMADMRNGIVVRDINGKTRIQLPTHTDAKPREIVIDPQGDNKYYVHMRVWDDVGKHVPGNISDIEKGNLFQTLYESLPDNAEILFPKSGPGNYGTRGTVAGLQRLSRDPRFTPGTKGTLQYLDKDGKTIKTYEGTSFIKTPKLQSQKQGGKMNILEFLKNGSGIHIKEKNKGKFTSYCGGKVTDECIRKAKASGNPTLVKRATFAANARKWKHKEGGKAFVTGINVLDSNPKAYKEVKKKYKMRSAQQGTKMNFFQKANNFLNSDLGKGLSSSLINGIGNIVSSTKATKAINAQNEALDTQLKAHKAKTFVEKYNENLQNQTDKSSIVRQSNAWNQANSQVSSENDFEKEINRQKLINEESAKQAQADAWYTTASNIAGTAINALNKNGVPKTVSSPSYFDNYVNTKYKKFGTFNPDGSMNMLGGTFTIDGGYKPNQPQLFNYQPLKLNV